MVAGRPPRITQDELKINRLLNMPPLNHESQVVDHADIIDFEFRLCILLTEIYGKFTQGLKSVREDVIFGCGQVLWFPVIFEFFHLVQNLKKGEI